MALSREDATSVLERATTVDRRRFLLHAAAVGLSAGAWGTFSRAWGGLVPAEALASGPIVRQLQAPLPVQGLGEEAPGAYDLSSPRVKIGHLLRRAGFGAGPGDVQRFVDMGVESTVDYLIDYERVDDGEMQRALAELDLDPDEPPDLQQWWLFRMVHTKRPLQEKMALFWHGHLVSAFSKVGRGPMMHRQNMLFRSHALSRFDDLLKAVSRDPAMLIYLDSRTNHKRAPNENFARELMELFSLGIGNYTEDDVRESARAFTGWSLDRREFRFRSFWHDYGVKSFLGHTGSFDGDDIVDIILEQPAAAEFITRRLFEFFAYENPEPEVIAPLADTFRASGYCFKPVMRQLLTSPEFYSAKAYRAKSKSPVELVAGTVRTLGIDFPGRAMAGLSSAMGQTLLNPPNVAGWPGGGAWINSTTLLHRLNLAHHLSWEIGRGVVREHLAGLEDGVRRIATTQVLNHFAQVLLDGNLPPEELEVLEAFAVDASGLSGLAGQPWRREVEVVSSLIYLLMASPDYQLN